MPAPLRARLNRHLALNMAAPDEEEDELLALLVGPCNKSLPTKPLLSSSGLQKPHVPAALPELIFVPPTSTSAIDLHDDSRQVPFASTTIPGGANATGALGTSDVSVIAGIPGDQGAAGVSGVQAGLSPRSFSHSVSKIDAFGFMWGKHYRQCNDLCCTGCVIAGLENLEGETDAILMPPPAAKRQRRN